MRKNLSMFFLISFIIGMSVVSASPTTLSVYPSRIIDQPEGNTFTVQVKLTEVTDLVGFQFKLGYDTTILDIVNVDVTTPTVWGDNYYQTKNEIDEAKGIYWSAVASMNPAPPFDGTTTLATITFKVTGRGESVLNLYDSVFSDSSIQQIPHDVDDGYFDNTGGRGAELGTTQDFGQTIVFIAVIVVIAILFGVYKFTVKKKKKRKK